MGSEEHEPLARWLMQNRPDAPCPSCGKLNDAVTSVDGDNAPAPGDISVCLYCGHIAAFDGDLKMRELTDNEIIALAGDRRIVTINNTRRLIKK